MMRSRITILFALILGLAVMPAMAAVSPIGTDMENPGTPGISEGCKGSTSRAVINVPGDQPTIQAAINAAAIGDEIVITGPHTEGGQITVNQDVIIRGVGAGTTTTIYPGTDTGQMSSCDTSRAFIYVPAGYTVTIADLDIDGTGRIIGSAIHSEGDLTVENCTISNIQSSIYLGRAIGLTSGHGIIRNCIFDNIGRIGIHVRGGCTTPAPTAEIDHCTYTGKGAVDGLDYAVEFGGGGTGTVTNSTFTNCTAVASSDGSTSAAVLITTYFGTGSSATLLGNVMTGNTQAIAAGYDSSDTSTIIANYNDFSGCTTGVTSTAATITADLEKNWWGTTDAATIATMATGPASMDYDPYLLTPEIRMAFFGNRLVDLQNDDGGWDWPLDDGNPSSTSPLNTIGPIAMGLSKAYRATSDPDMLTALGNAGGLLLSKTNNFSPSDGYLAAELDAVLGGTAYVDHVVANYYDPLAAGTYNKNGDGTLYDTDSYLQLIHDSRSSYPNMAAWDIGMGLAAAVMAGVTGTELDPWIDWTKTEIDGLDANDYYDVIGLAGTVYGLAVAGEDHNPTAGEHAAAESLADLADILASYQIVESGGFAWNAGYVIPYDCNELIQETSYAALALSAAGGYDAEVMAAGDYMLDVQLTTGGWKNHCGSSSENNEVSAEGGWGVWESDASEITLVPDSDCYEDGDTVTVEIWMNNVVQDIVGGQFFLNYDDSMLSFGTATGETPFQNLYLISSTSGELDYAVIIPAPNSTTGDAHIATLTFTALTNICSATDLITWRSHVPPTRLSGEQGQPIYPDLLAMDVLDDEAPVISCPPGISVQCPGDVPLAYADLTEFINAGGSATDNCSDTLTLSCTDSGLQGGPCIYQQFRVYRVTDHCGNYAECTQIITAMDTIPPVATAGAIASCFATQAAAETAALAATSATDNCTDPGDLFWSVSTVGDCSAMITVTVADECWNSDSVIYYTTIDNTPPVITGCPSDITVNAEAGLCTADVSWTPPTASDNCGVATFSSTHVPGDTFPSGTTTVTYTAVDVCGNTTVCSFNVTVNDVNEMVVTLSLDGGPVSPLDRCITFELYDCGGGGGGTIVTDVITFTGGSATATVLVPCGVYTCVTARDALHTLARTEDSLTINGSNQYVAVFDDDLLGGNLNDDAWVDILDFGVFSYLYGPSTSPTDCSTAAPHADIDGNGQVGTGDFSYIQINFLETHDPACCSGPAPLGGSQPVTSVSVEDLIARGLSELAAGDLNNDGWLDQQDIVAFMEGARPHQIGSGGVVKPGLQQQK